MNSSTLSVVLISNNEKEYLAACLSALMTPSLSEISFEIIWVDNGSLDGSSEYVSQNYSFVKQVVLSKNHGVSYARNRALKLAGGEFVLILDVDTIPNMEAIRSMIDYLRNNNRCGLCGCSLVDANGVVQDSYKRFPNWKFKANNVLISLFSKIGFNSVSTHIENLNRQYTYGEIKPTQPFMPDYLIGACQLFRRSLLSEVGFLDESIFYGPEDADFCLRIRQKGYSVVYLPAYSIVHHWQRSSSKKPFSRIALKHLQGLIYFYWKWRNS